MMGRGLCGLVVVVLMMAAGGCAEVKYATTPVGKVGGKVRLVWVGPDQFVYERDANDPLYFERANGERIVPESIYTDGGSIPRAMWVFRNYSPWGYGPAFVIHDWLFDAHHCKVPELEKYTVQEAAEVMAECQKTLMESGKAPRSAGALYVMYLAVKSPVAAKLWETGKCVKPSELAPEFFNARPAVSVTWDLNDAPDRE